MFVLTTISDVIRIAPSDFEPRKKSIHALEDNIHKKYADKVLQQVGLCICFWDLLKVSDGLISHGDGMVNINVTFRLVVFRPFRGEIIQGLIKHCDEQGVRVSTDFFHDIWIPGTRLQEPARYSPEDETWVWDYEGQPFHYDLNEPVRLRVESEIWFDITPERESSLKADNKETKEDAKVPYTIIGSMADPYLGCIFWWEEREETNEEQTNGVDQMVE